MHLVEYLKKSDLPQDVELIDAGTAGLNLIDFMCNADKVVIVDAVCAGGEAGQIYSFSPEDFESESSPKISLHDIALKDIFRVMQKMGSLPRIKIIGIEPKSIDVGTELSPELEKQLVRLGDLVLKEIRDA